MKTWLKILIILAVVGLTSAAAVWNLVINKPHTDYSKVKADVQILATDLFKAFTENKPAANLSYTGKVVQLKGNFAKIDKNDSSATVIFVFRQGEFGDEGIRCILLPTEKEKASQLKPDQEIELKGFCTGYNESDVLIEKCVFVK